MLMRPRHHNMTTRMRATRTDGHGRSVQEALDLGQHDPAAIVRRLRNGEDIADDGFFVHEKVPVRVGGRGAEQADVDRDRLVPQPGLAPEFHALDQGLDWRASSNGLRHGSGL